MITKLTKKQEQHLLKYRQEILRFGRFTEPSDRKTTEKWITFFYKQIGQTKPVFFWFDGPFSGMIGIEVLRQNQTELRKLLKKSNLWSNLELNLGSNLESNLGSNLRSNLELNLGSNLWSNLRSNLGSNLRSNLELNLWSNLELNLRSNLGSNLRSNLGSNLESNLRSNLESNLNNCFWGQHELAWIAFYDFCSLIGVPYKKTDRKILDGWLGIGKSTGWWFPFEGICFCCERHNVLNINEDGRLHCPHGPAMGFKDGFEIYALNGINVKKEYITTSIDQINPQTILSEPNVDVRRELIRRVGVERFLQHLPHKVIDKSGDYELLNVELSENIKNARYLKMLNPSIGVWHVEGVEGNTIQAALNFRAQRVIAAEENWQPSILT